MPSNQNNGGKRINKLEQSNAVQDTKLDMLIKQVGETHSMLSKALPQIIRNEERICSHSTWLKALWGIGIAIAVLGIKAAFFR